MLLPRALSCGRIDEGGAYEWVWHCIPGARECRITASARLSAPLSAYEYTHSADASSSAT